MALDPTISLKAGSPSQLDYAGAVTKAQGILTQQQNLQNLRAQEEQTRAATEGTRAGTRVTTVEAQTKERELAAKKWIEQNAQKHMKIIAAGPNMGRRELDYSSLTTAMAEAGFADLAPTVQAAWAANTAQSIQNQTNEQARAGAAVTFGRQMASQDAAIMRNLTPAQQQELMQRNLTGLEGVAPEAVAAYKAALGETDIGKRAMAIYEAPRTAQQLVDEQLQRISLAQGAEGLAQAGAAGQIGPQERDPNSAASRNAREAYFRATGVRLAESVSAAQVPRLPGAQEMIGAEMIPAGTRVAAKEQQADINSQISVLDSGLRASQQLRDPNLTRAGSLTQAGYLRLVEQNPNLAQFQSAVDAMNKAQGTDVQVWRDGLNAVQARVRQYQQQLQTQSQARGAVAASPTVRGAVAPQTGMTILVRPDGRRIRVPNAEVERALSLGARRVE